MLRTLLKPVLALPLLAIALLPCPAPARAPSVPRAPDREEASFQCDAVVYDGMLDDRTSIDLEPAHSLDAVIAVLTRHHVGYERRRGTFTFPDLPVALARKINVLPSGEPFIIPGGNQGLICVLVPSAGSV